MGSGPHTSALVELYTSQRCSACAAAERWLASLAERLAPGRVVAATLLLERRAYTGEAYPADEPRAPRLTARQRLALVHAPVVLLQGRAFAAWATPAFEAELGRIIASPPRARLVLEIVSAESAFLEVRAAAEVLDAREAEHAALYLAAHEERGAARVLEWRGPIEFSRARIAETRVLPLVPGAAAARSGVIGFVQNRRSAEVLQAAALPACL